MNKEYKAFLDKYAATAERLRKAGFHAFGFDPGYLCEVSGSPDSLNLSDSAAKLIGEVVIKAYPETASDVNMIAAWRKRKETEDVQ